MITNCVEIAKFQMLFTDKEILLLRCVLNCMECGESSSEASFTSPALQMYCFTSATGGSNVRK